MLSGKSNAFLQHVETVSELHASIQLHCSSCGLFDPGFVYGTAIVFAVGMVEGGIIADAFEADAAAAARSEAAAAAASSSQRLSAIGSAVVAGPATFKQRLVEVESRAMRVAIGAVSALLFSSPLFPHPTLSIDVSNPLCMCLC
jgi:hypothetical protein